MLSRRATARLTRFMHDSGYQVYLGVSEVERNSVFG